MNPIKRAQLVAALQGRPAAQNEKLTALTHEAQSWRDQEDWLWRALIRSHATLGGAAAYGHLLEGGRHDELLFENLIELPPDQRQDTIQEIFANAGVRYTNNKTAYMIYNLNLFDKYSNMVHRGQELMELTFNDCIKQLRKYKGIGPKYARNICMDLRLLAFEQSIAIDSRIEKFIHWLEFNPHENANYETKEASLLSIAAEADLSGWELDRLLFNFYQQYKNELNVF